MASVWALRTKTQQAEYKDIKTRLLNIKSAREHDRPLAVLHKFNPASKYQRSSLPKQSRYFVSTTLETHICMCITN